MMNSQFISDIITSIFEKLAAPKWVKVMRNNLGSAGVSEASADKINSLVSAMHNSGYDKARQVSKGLVGHGALSDVYAMYDPKISDEIKDMGGTVSDSLIARKVPRNKLPNFLTDTSATTDTRRAQPGPDTTSWEALAQNNRAHSNQHQQAMTDIQKAYGMKSMAPTIVHNGSEAMHQPFVFGFKSISDIERQNPVSWVNPTNEIRKAYDVKSSNKSPDAQRYKDISKNVGPSFPGYMPPEAAELIDDLSTIRNCNISDLHEGNVGIVPSNLNKHLNPNLHGLTAMDYLLYDEGRGPFDTGKYVSKLKDRGMSEDEIIARMNEFKRGPGNIVEDIRQSGINNNSTIMKMLKQRGFSTGAAQKFAN